MTDAVLIDALADDAAVDRPELWHVRADGIAGPNGRVVVFVAEDGEDVTKAVEHVSRRFAPLSAGMLGIDSQCGVRTQSGMTVTGSEPPGEAASTTEGDEPAQPLRLCGVVVLTRTDDGPTSPNARRLTIDHALPALIAQSSQLRSMRAPLRGIASLLEAIGGVVGVASGDLVAIDEQVDALMRARPPHRVPGHVAPVDRVAAAEVDRQGARLFRAATLDAIVLSGDRIAVLRKQGDGEELRILGASAAAVWRAAGGLSLADVVDAVDSMQGPSRDDVADRSPTEVATDLLAQGLLADHPSWAISDGAAWTSAHGRTTVVDLWAARSRLLVLEGSAHWVWVILAERSPLSEEELIRECARLFQVSEDTVAEDVVGLLAQLRLEGLLDLL